jgi:pyruvate dehydrogenase E2 component (dihydrolipoamide acetyltransferase)
MAELIIMPKLGFNMSEGKLVKWYKKEGDAVKKGEPLFAVETDKTSIDIESTCDGYVRKLFIEEGDKLAVTLPIAIVADKDESIEDLMADAYARLGKEVISEEKTVVSAATVEDGAGKAPATKVAKTERRRYIATPRARRVAEELGIDLASADIAGTGFEGGICEKDVLQYAASVPKVKATPLAKKMSGAAGLELSAVVGTGIGGKVMKRDVEGAVASAPAAATTVAGEMAQDGKEILEKVPYAGVRRIIGERLSSSMFSAPHIFFTQKVNLERLLELRKQVNENQNQKTSVTDYIAKAVILTLQKYPDVNVSLVGDTIEKYKSINLGIAVAAPTGLIVPVIKNSQNMSLLEISKAASALIQKAREGRLTPDEYSGGTFTISNLGMFGINQFTAIINPPESAILAVSATQDEPVVFVNEKGEKEIAVKPMMNITLSADHRVIDGLLAAQAVAEIKALLEQPIRLFL